ncbi:MAG: DUF5723 family protein [Bacteroidota bacterium]|jgi:hypothetical protein
MRKNLLMILALGTLLSGTLRAQDLSNIRGIGMAQTTVATSRGTDAIGINPANVALPEWNPVTLSLPNLGMKIRTELFTYDIYQNYFTGVPDSTGKRVSKLLTNADKNNILSQMPAIPQTRFMSEVQWIGFSLQTPVLGGIGFAIRDHLGTTIAMSKDYFRLAAFGLDPSGSSYDFSGTSGQAWWYREYNISYGRKLPVTIPFLKNLYAGIGVKLIKGYGIFESTQNNTSFTNTPDPSDPFQYITKGKVDFLARHAGIEMLTGDSGKMGPTFNKFKAFPDPIGTGTGFDIGITGTLLTEIQMAVSITNIGKITWDKNIIESYGNDSVTITNPFTQFVGQNDSMLTAIKGKNRPGASFTTSLPTALRVGMMMEAKNIPGLRFLPGNLILAFDYLQGFNESLGNTKKPRVSLGMEYRIIPLIPLRTGLSLGGGDIPRWAFGFGIDASVFSFDLATDNFGFLFSGKNFQMFSISAGMKIRI